MNYLSVKEIASLWNISERSVRNYCAEGRVPGAFLTGKTWNIPENAEKPERSNKSKPAPQTLLDILKEEKRGQVHGGIYHKIQIELTYNSNHIEGSRLTHDQTRYIFETNTIGITDEGVRVDDIIETSTHFRCIDEIIENAKSQLSEKFIKHLHFILKTGTSDSKKDWFAVGRVVEDDTLRILLFDHIRKVEPLDTCYTYPESFDINKFINNTLSLIDESGNVVVDEESSTLDDRELFARQRYKDTIYKRSRYGSFIPDEEIK